MNEAEEEEVSKGVEMQQKTGKSTEAVRTHEQQREIGEKEKEAFCSSQLTMRARTSQCRIN